MKIYRIILFSVCLICLGCIPPKTTFYWGDYSSTLYELKKNPDDRTLDDHKKELLLIFDESDRLNLKVPPGLYAEYGYILLKDGHEIEGLEYLDKELSLYPESKVFIYRLKSEIARRKK
ncbi:MAG: DUF4810 domain-containing protein [Ignavibacteria bacterium]|nr:DUF4810 domain-containing protein [Ignavibacteria bacterium]